MSEGLSLAVFVVLLLVTVVILLFVFGHLAALISGWKKLAVHYPAGGDPEGETFRWRSIGVGRMGYSNCINLAAGKSGLRLSGSFLIRLGHDPLFLPWREITATAHRGWFFNYIDLRAAKTPELRIRLPRLLGEAALRAGAPKAPQIPELALASSSLKRNR